MTAYRLDVLVPCKESMGLNNASKRVAGVGQGQLGLGWITRPPNIESLQVGDEQVDIAVFHFFTNT